MSVLKTIHSNESEIKEYKFGTSDLVVPIRADGMINATALCKAAGKRIEHYKENLNTKAYLDELSSVAGIPVTELFLPIIGGKYPGTWVHRKVGYHLAQWISPKFALQMETILDELKNNKKQLIIKEVKPLVINDYTIVYRKEDGYVDVTNLCKAGGKLFKNWNGLEKTQAFIKVLSCVAGIPATQLLSSIKGGKAENQGTWAHPQVAINIAQWISPEFDVQVSKWIFELMVTGKVELGNEKSNEELESLYKQQIKTLTNQLEKTTNQLETNKEEHHKLLVKYNSSLKKHSYYKFKETGPCFYVFHSGYEYLDRVIRKKFGIAGTSDKDGKVDTIDSRLQSHRTNHPNLRLDFLMFTKDARFIEDGFKRYYHKEINPNGHEWIENITTEQIIERVKAVLKDFNIEEYNIVSDKTLKKYNDYVITTVKVENEEVDTNSIATIEEISDDEEESNVESNVVESKVEPALHLIEEKVDGIKEQMDEYKQILQHLESFTVKKMDEILRKIGGSLTGTKDVKIKKIKDKLSDKVTEPIISMKVCETCNENKALNEANFRKYDYKLITFSNNCKSCEIKQYNENLAPVKQLVQTAITPDMKTKKCKMCTMIKSLDDFYKNKSRADGHEYNCKNCETLRKSGTYDVREVKKQPKNIPEHQKWCPKCESVMDKTKFCPAPTRPDGLQHSCRPCYNKQRSAKRKLNKI